MGSVFSIGSRLLYSMLLFHRIALLKVEIKPHGNSVNKTADYFVKCRRDTPEKHGDFVTR